MSRKAGVAFVLIASAILLTLVSFAYLTRMPAAAGRPLAPLTPEEIATARNLRTHVEHLAGETGGRSAARPESPAHAANYIHEQLVAVGLIANRHPYTAAGQTFLNIDAELRGQTTDAAMIVVGAHYDI